MNLRNINEFRKLLVLYASKTVDVPSTLQMALIKIFKTVTLPLTLAFPLIEEYKLQALKMLTTWTQKMEKVQNKLAVQNVIQ
jgi:hypothetical protein